MSEDRIEELLVQLTLAEQVSLLSGKDFWSTPAVPRLGIGALRVTDGPNGARGGGSLIGGVKSAAFPVGIALGASWNTSLLREIGGALADEVKSKGAHMLLGPTVNIHRSVTNGRNFECYSEDPILTAELASAYITGLQAEGIAATIKHFVGNESEIERTSMSSEIDERSLREVYLLPFEWAVKKAKSWGLMSSYNRLNGVFTSENEWLLSTVLRGEWGFDGVVVSDWFGSHATAETVNAGLDLEMPGPPRDRGQKLLEAVKTDKVSAAKIAERALNMLRLLERVGALDDHREPKEAAHNRPAHRALIRRAGTEGTVLLKNDGVLPLDQKSGGKLAVVGPNAKIAQIMGGGSSQLNPHYQVSPFEGLVAALGGDSRLSYAKGCDNHRFEPLLTGEFKVEFFNSPELLGGAVHTTRQQNAEAFWFGAIADGKVDPARYSVRLTGKFTPEVTAEYRVGVFSAGLSRVYVDGKLIADAWRHWQAGRTFFEEGCDEVVGTISLDAGRAHQVTIEFATRPAKTLGFAAFRAGIGRPLGDADIAAAVEVAKAAETALVFIGRSGEWDTEGSDLTDITLPGRQNELVEAVAAVNPRTVVVLQTGGPVEMPWIDKVAGVMQAWYPGQEAGNAIADVLFGDAEPGGRLPQSFPVKWEDNPTHSQDPDVYPGKDGKVRYEEGVFVGYRHYDKLGVEPLFPFGFGLNYTKFSLADLAIDADGFEADGRVSVALMVTNTGERAGSEVIQLYVGDDEASVPRPQKELKAFAKVFLQAGQSQRVTLQLDDRAFAFYRTQARHWLIEPGSFSLHIGTSAASLPLTGKVSRTTMLMLPV